MRASATLLWVAAFLFSLSTLVFLNDHFGRISPARQIAMYGELPFRDFFDPGYFMSELSAAALLRLLGDNLLGEALLTTAAFATGTVVVHLMTLRLTSSFALALAAASLSLLLLPRAYDYDKVAFYPLIVLLCWRYAERRTAGSAGLLAAGVVAAALFRYDTGVYAAAAVLAAMTIVHRSDWTAFGRRVALVAAVSACLTLPALLFLHDNGGIVDAADQMVTYGRRETARTRVPAQRFAFAGSTAPTSRSAPDPAGGPLWWSAANANVYLYWLMRSIPLLAAVLAVADVRRGRASTVGSARLASLIVMCALLNVFILRDPVGARIGGMAGPAAVLAAWLAHRAWRRRPGIGGVAMRAAVALAAAATVVSIAVTAEWSMRLTSEIVRPAHLRRVVGLLAATPPSLETLSNRGMTGLVRYIRECTGPGDRVFATWFAPELYFFAQRGFAGRIVALFGEHWSEPRFQARSLETLASQSVPIVLTRTGDEALRTGYPELVRFLDEHYRVAGASDFGDAQIGENGYTVLVRRDRRPTRTYSSTPLPCFW